MGVGHLDPAEFLSFLHEFEAVRNQMGPVDDRVLRDAEERDLAGTLCEGRFPGTRALCRVTRPGDVVPGAPAPPGWR